MIQALTTIDQIDPKRCREIAIAKFGKDQMVNNYIKAYEDILGSGK